MKTMLLEDMIETARRHYIAALLSNCGPEYVERKRLALQAALKLAEGV